MHEEIRSIGIVFHRDGIPLEMNPAFAAIFGLPEEELIGRDLTAFVHPEDRSLVLENIRSERSGPYFPRILRRNGEVVHLEVHGHAIIRGGERLRLAEFRDVTARVAAESALLRSETALRIAGNLARFGGWRVDLSANRVFWTDQVAEIHGMPAGFSPTVEEGISYYAPEWRERIREVYTACATEGKPYDEELQIIDANARRVWVRTCGVALRDGAGRIVEVTGAFQDLTERKAAEARERAWSQRLTRMREFEAVVRLAGGTAHHLNNMLAVILGRLEMVTDRLGPDDPALKDLREIESAARSSSDLIRHLLAFARRQPIILQPLELNAAIGAILPELRRLLTGDVSCAFRPSPDLPAVRFDASQVGPLLTSLFLNAREAIRGRGSVSVETALARFGEAECDASEDAQPGDYARLTVSDDGCGMDEATRARLFEPFFTTKGIGEGTGLGLAKVYGIVKQCGGFILVESAVGSGSAFHVHLPLWREGNDG